MSPQALVALAPLALVSLVMLQAASFDLMLFMERFGLPTTIIAVGCYAMFVRQWVVPGWYLTEERTRYREAEARHKDELRRANERADRMENALLKALGASEVIAEVVRARGGAE